MFHWPIKTPGLPLLAALAAAALSFFSCGEDAKEAGYIPGFMDLRQIGISLVPAESNSLLPGEYSPVVVSFDTEMRKEDTEGILQISSDAGTVGGDRIWKGNKLCFVPSPPWTAGTRYVLNLSGTVYSADGRDLRLERYIPFYAINKSGPPLLEHFSPAGGEPAGTEGITMELRFSVPMDRLSVELAFVLEGVSEKKFEWSNDDRVLKIILEKSLLPWTVYHWTLKAGAKSRDGVPLAKEYSDQFSTDLDKVLPRVKAVFPVLNSGGQWLPTGGGIENDLGPGQGIAVEFNKPMGDSMLRSLRFEPPVAGKTEALSSRSVVFIPNKDPDPETAYTLIISADTRDLSGLKLGSDHRVTFVPDIPFLRILSFNVDGLAGISTPFNNIRVLEVPLNITVLRFNIRFSLPFSAEAKQNAALKISLSPYFPGTLDPIALRSVTWLSDDLIRMEWERLKSGTAGEVHLYRLLLPGGRGGIDNGGGMYFAENQEIYLEAMQ